MADAATTDPTNLAALDARVRDLQTQLGDLSEQIGYLSEMARAEERSRREWAELREDLTPVLTDMYAVTVEQLEEVEAYVRLDDVLHLAKRVARNTRNLERMLDQLESLRDFLEDAGPLTDDVFQQAVLRLDELDRKGYFGFARESMAVVDNVVTSFTEEDVRQLGENVVLILRTVKAMTQPEIMNLVNSVTRTYQETERSPEALETSVFSLVRQMRDPEVRRGLALTLALLRTVARQPANDPVERQAEAPT